jgi:hypothetical protein
MLRRIARSMPLLAFFAFLAACGDQSLFMSMKSDTTDLQITSIADGQVLTSGTPVPLLIRAENTGKSRDVEIEVTLTSAAGQSVWHNRAAATLNEQTPIALPANLPSGLYRLDLVLYSSGEVAQKKSSSFFVAGDAYKITGIKSFPPVITATASVMLKAELAIPVDADPYLRWSWKGKVIAKGALSRGLGQVIWAAPSDEGVYTITLELFPSSPPAGSDFTFTSSLLLSTDIFVSAGSSLGRSDLGPESSYLSLLHMQANLTDAGTGAKKLGKAQALPVGAPDIVPLEDGFGYRLNGSSGIQIPWLTLPIDGGVLKPFTVSLGVMFEDLDTANRILTASAADGGVSLAISIDPSTHAPLARLSTVGNGAVILPWSGPGLSKKQRYLLSLSVVPRGEDIVAQWFLDGVQVSLSNVPYKIPGVKQEGTTVIGGEKGFKGIVDEFGIYYRDAEGRPSTDPDQFLRAHTIALGSNLVLADGFDGIFLSTGFALEGSGQIGAGSLTLPPDTMLDLPPLKMEGSSISVNVDLAPGSARSATLLAQWEGSSERPLQYPLVADAAGLRFKIGADGNAIIVPAGTAEKTLSMPKPPQAGASLLLKISNPAEAGSPMVIDQLLAAKDRK